MMAYTDRHCRFLHRLASPSAKLFTEMVTTGALLNGPSERLLAHHETEHPVALQLGGSDPAQLAQCTKRADEAGFDEINLNVGCPSARVVEGRIGACLMAEPALVADCYSAMQAVTARPVTVKCRLGIDDFTTDAFLDEFIGAVANAGCDTFYVHARIALLNGLSPAQNRSIPPLRYDRVRALKTRWPQLQIVLNGGISEPRDALDALAEFDGAMIGRAAYSNPLLLTELHRSTVDASATIDAHSIYTEYCRYVEREVAQGTKLSNLTRHVLGLFSGRPGTRRFRQLLSDNNVLRSEGVGALDLAYKALQRRAA